MATPAPQPSISIDVTKDLTSLSALKTALTSDEGALFSILGELAEYAAQPVSSAAAAKASASITLNGNATWTTSNKISFSLTPQASCSCLESF